MAKPKTPEKDKSGPQRPPAFIAAATPGPVPALFRKIDWLTLLLTFGAMWIAYFLTLAPELTLQDSGELAVGSYYAGVPHPPGYPVWTLYTWVWTVLLPFKNIAWRVALGEATAGAMACGLLGMMVSRGSSLLMEGIEELKAMSGKWENAICVVSGFAAGLMMGFNGFMWSQSVIVEVYLFGVLSFMIVMLCLLRWIYAPHQMRYAYWALFMFGVCFTNHQSLIVAAIGVEITLAAGNPKLGREIFFGNFLIWLLDGLILLVTNQHAFANIGAKQGLLIIFNTVGVGSLVAACWLAIVTKIKGIEVGRSITLAGIFASLVLALLNGGNSGVFLFWLLIAFGLFVLFVWLARQTWHLSREWLHVLILGGLWILGASFYFYMPLAGMTNPPIQWGYPRTVEGFLHALTRGQYEQPNPTNVLAEPGRFTGQLGMLLANVGDEFTLVYCFLALVPYFFFLRMQKRERAWIIGLTSIYLCLGVLLMILLNPTPDRASADLVKVFFTASHMVVAAMVGYGLALTSAFMATHYQRFRIWAIAGGGVAVLLALYELFRDTAKTYFGEAGSPSLSQVMAQINLVFQPNYYRLPVIAGLLLLAMTLLFLAGLLIYRNRAPLAIALAIFTLSPVNLVLNNWADVEQRGHMFGYWFGHDMFTPPFKGADGTPLYPEMTKDAILYGGTDPGRFCPTYMIFCESFTPHDCQPVEDQKFDRRDVYIITQNALADGTYLNYIRAHYNRSTQIDPPFFQELFRSSKEKELNYRTNLLARIVSPLDTIFGGLGARIEKRRRTYTSWFSEKEFTDFPAFARKLKPEPGQDPVSKFLYDNLSSATRQLLSGKADEPSLRSAVIKDLNTLLERELLDKKAAPLYDAERFKGVQISEYLQDFIRENPKSSTRIRLNRLLLEAAYPKEIVHSIGGVYPDREMYIATPEDSQKCFQEYLADAQKRLQHDMQFPNEPRQIRPGEDVKVVDNRVTVAGQVAVMAINGLLTKVMFDHNPKNEFFVEESFPLDWMYPHLTPYGIIMKINREPLPTLSADVLRRDHEFWKQYSHRLTGEIIDYDTPVQKVADWIEKTYLQRNYNGFTGDLKFVRDNDGQKAFSKLRSSIGGIYAWRLGPQCPPQYRPKNDAEFQAILREAEYTFKQALAFCPYSPEAVFRYVNLLIQLNRIDDALIVAQTCLKLDPYNGQVAGLISNLKAFKEQQGGFAQARNEFQNLENQMRTQPTNHQAAIELAAVYFQLQQTNRVTQILDGLMTNPSLPPSVVVRAAQLYSQMLNWPKLESSLEKLVQVSPESPEAWYDLAAFKANLRKNSEALPALSKALELSAKRRQSDPKARDLVAEARKDERFTAVKSLPEFQKLVGGK